MIQFNSLLFLLLISFSCTSHNTQKEENLKKEIMDIHDEVMPKMGNIYNLKKELEKNREYLTSDSIPSNTPKISTSDLDSLLEALENADESMMSWMRSYNKFDDENLSHEEQMEYLQKEKEKIETVRLKMISSIKEAENLLEKEPRSVETEN
jgi:cell division FtsZ-interacting protein ZapD